MTLLYLCILGWLLGVYHGQAQEIALTFDDAPMNGSRYYQGTERTDTLIAKLQRLGIEEVAFFVNPIRMVEEGRSRVLKYAQAGHLIGNHSYTHAWLHKIGVDNYIRDIERADSAIKNVPNYVKWYRFPYLDEGRKIEERDSIRAALKRMDYLGAYVTVDNYEWYLNALLQEALKEKKKINYQLLKTLYIEHIWKSVQFYDQIGQKVLGRSPKHVLLLHENDISTLFIEELIVFLRAKGWKIISPREAYKDAIAQVVTQTNFNGQGRVGAIAQDQGMKRVDLVQESEDTAYLKAYFEKQKVFE